MTEREEGEIRTVRETNLFKEFIHKAFLHPHCDFILLLRRLLPLDKHTHTQLGIIIWNMIFFFKIMSMFTETIQKTLMFYNNTGHDCNAYFKVQQEQC